MTRNDDQAIPTAGFAYSDGSYESGNSGLTIREHFAAMAMQGLLANPHYGLGDIASQAVQMADELIEALNK